MEEVIILEKSFDKPWENLAYEECLMNYAKKNKDVFILYLWQNRNSVVIGRNQNPWKELDFDVIRQEKIDLARRITGGGAVYHDLGNLNFTFILPQKVYEEKKTSQIIVEALNWLNIPANVSGRNDICCNGKKISGSAFCVKDGIGLHHGTLLLDVNLDRMSRCLTPDKAKLISKGIDSVNSRVMNLKMEFPNITIEDLKKSIKKIFLNQYAFQNSIVKYQCKIDEVMFKRLIENYSSYKWLYGEAMDNNEEINVKLAWGIVDIKMQFDDMRIKKCVIETDALEVNIFGFIASKIENCNLVEEELNRIISEEFNDFSLLEKKMAEDIINIIIKKIRV